MLVFFSVFVFPIRLSINCICILSRLWLYNIAHGIDHEPVTVRLIPKSIGCSKNFPGKTALATKKNVEHWMRELTSELVVRLTEDQENVCRCSVFVKFRLDMENIMKISNSETFNFVFFFLEQTSGSASYSIDCSRY